MRKSNLIHVASVTEVLLLEATFETIKGGILVKGNILLILTKKIGSLLVTDVMGCSIGQISLKSI